MNVKAQIARVSKSLRVPIAQFTNAHSPGSRPITTTDAVSTASAANDAHAKMPQRLATGR